MWTGWDHEWHYHGQFFCLRRGHRHHKKQKRYKKTKEREDSGKKRRNNSSLYYILHGENNSHTSKDFKVLNSRSAEKYKSNYGKADYNNNIKELNLLQAEAAHQKSKHEKLNKDFTKRNTSNDDTVNIADSPDINSSYRSESNNPYTKTGRNSITYDSDSADDGKIISSSTINEDNNWLDGCRDEFIIDK